MCRWSYSNKKIKEGEIGSSAMPIKSNLSTFENVKGILGLQMLYLEHFSSKTPSPDYQRD